MNTIPQRVMIWLVLVLALTSSHWVLNLSFDSATSTPTSTPLPLSESRELDITFLGIDESTVDKTLLTSIFNTTEAPYPAEYPSGERLSEPPRTEFMIQRNTKLLKELIDRYERFYLQFMTTLPIRFGEQFFDIAIPQIVEEIPEKEES